MDIGVLGGTFDPIHNGHLAVAEEARIQLNLAEVLYVVAGQPWLKPDSPVAAAEHRVKMVRLALAAKPYFRVSTTEIERAGPTYTVDTMAELKAQFGARNKLFFILGWDSLAEFPRWKEPSRLIKICRLVAVPRPGSSCPDLQALEAAVPGLSQRLIFLNKPQIDISATAIRSRVAQGLPIDHLIPKAVDEYIKRHKLYVTQ